MIVTRIQADNVLKYRRLELNTLPTRGVIAVSGENESGKSSIAETLCFALFGRTYSLDPEGLRKLIHWSETRCSATVGIEVNGQRYEVTRHLDDQANQGARLTQVAGGKTLARGADAVQKAVTEVVGCGFEEFIESFYLAQREITTPHPHSAAIKSMAGIAPLETVSHSLELDLQRQSESVAEGERDRSGVDQRIRELNLDEGELWRLQAQHQTVTDAKTENLDKITALDTLSDQFTATLGDVRQAADALLSAELNTSYQGWAERTAKLQSCVDALQGTLQRRAGAPRLTEGLEGFLRASKGRLEHFQGLRTLINPHRRQLSHLLGERGLEAAAESQPGVEESVRSIAEQRQGVLEQLAATKKQRRLSRLGFIVSLVVAVVLWVLWVLLAKASDSGLSVQLAEWLASRVTGWANYYQPLLLPGAGVASASLIILGLRGASLDARMARMRQEAGELDENLNLTQREAESIDNMDIMPLPEAVDVLASLRDEGIREGVQEFAEESEEGLLSSERLASYKAKVEGIVQDYSAGIESECKELAVESGAVRAEVATLDGELKTLAEAISVEQERRRQHEELDEMLRVCEVVLQQRRRQLQVYQLSGDLVVGASRHISLEFNRDIRVLVGRLLPRMTQGRYEHLQIDENLDVRVFSNEKRDFMDLKEVSSGTQRQIMLAVRLALSQELIKTTQHGEQAIFLDEPFAFFDEERTRASLAVIPELTREIAQVWIMAQQFPDGLQAEMRVQCARERDELIVTAA
jgi:DNA repair exonuclease SbcCD ATPase subunit